MKSIGIELRNLMNLIIRHTHKTSGTEEISMQHAAIIKYMTKNKDKDIHPKDLEEVFMMRKSTCSRMLSLMEKNNLIIRIDDALDSRKKIIKLTDKSIQICNYIEDKYEKLDDKMSNNINPEDLDIFFKVLDQIKNNIIEEKED